MSLSFSVMYVCPLFCVHGCLVLGLLSVISAGRLLYPEVLTLRYKPTLVTPGTAVRVGSP